MANSEQAMNIILSSNKQTEAIYTLSKAASNIALQHFHWSFITLVYFNSTFWSGAEIFLQSYKKAVVIGKGTFDPMFVAKTRQYVLFGNSITDIVQTLEWMREHEFDNTGKYVIVCQSLDKRECDEAAAMRALWEFKIINVILLKSANNEPAGFTYFPLNDKACTYDVPVQLVNFASCLDVTTFLQTCNFFPMKLSNLKACPLTVSTFLQHPYMRIKNGIPTGSDGDLLRLISEKLNGNISLITPKIGGSWGKLEKDNTWSGSFGDIFYGYANISITSAALTLTRFPYFQLSTDYNTASVVWITHTSKKVPSSVKLTYPFKIDAQIALVISFAIVVMYSLIIRSRFYVTFSQKMKLERPRSSIVFYSWMICMGLPTTRLPRKTVFLCIVFLWVWYCFLIRTFYQVTLISALKSTYYYQEFQTIEDAIDAGYPFGGGGSLKDYYVDYPAVYNHWKEIDSQNIIPTLRNISIGMKFVLAIKLEKAQAHISKEKMHVHVLPQKVVTSPTVLFFKKYSPLADAVNSALLRLIESGFTDKLYKYYYTTTMLDQKTGDTAESLKLEHYTGCYVVLITGWIVSFILWIGEIVFTKLYFMYR